MSSASLSEDELPQITSSSAGELSCSLSLGDYKPIHIPCGSAQSNCTSLSAPQTQGIINEVYTMTIQLFHMFWNINIYSTHLLQDLIIEYEFIIFNNIIEYYSDGRYIKTGMTILCLNMLFQILMTWNLQPWPMLTVNHNKQF